MIGKTISHYNILNILGEGGMGVVYKARDLHLDRLVAIKFLPRSLSLDDQNLQQFLGGARAASTLDHPNICPVYEFDKLEDGTMFLVMAYCSGETLQQLLDNNDEELPGLFSLDQIVNIASQIAEGLAEAHKKGIIHRDIKPANIVIDEEGQVKILDFGLAAMKKDISRTENLFTAGTVKFMSPEQTIGELVDQRTDIWSLGVLIYQMLTNNLPFDGDQEQAIIYSILKEDPEPISAINKEVPGKLEEIVNKAISKNPDGRYKNADEILHDIRRTKYIKDRRSSQKKRVSTSTYLFSSIVIFILFILFGLNLFIPQSESPHQKYVVAVVPFENLSPQPANAYLGGGLAEDIRQKLCLIQDLTVLGRESLVFKGDTISDLGEIDSQLGTAFALKGSVRLVKDQVQLKISLIDTRTEEYIWEKQFDEHLSHIFKIQNEIVEYVAFSLDVKITSEEKKHIQRTQTKSLHAYQYYLQGREYFEKSKLPLAIQNYTQAVKIDPTYACALVGLADGYLSIADYQGFADNTPDSALEIIEKAIAIDPFCSEAYHLLGKIYTGRVSNNKYWYPRAEYVLRKAIEINPNGWKTMMALGWLNRIVQQYDEALDWFGRAQIHTPQNGSIFHEKAMIYRYLNRYSDALENYDIALKFDMESEEVFFHRALVWVDLDKYEDAIQSFKQAIQLDPLYQWSHHDLAVVYKNCGKFPDAIREFKIAGNINPEQPWHFLGLASVHEEQENYEKALEIYQQAYSFFADNLAFCMSYSFCLERSGREIEAREIVRSALGNSSITVTPLDSSLKYVARFYVGTLNEKEVLKVLNYASLTVKSNFNFNALYYYLGLSNLYKSNNLMESSLDNKLKAEKYLRKYLSGSTKDEVEYSLVRAKLKRLKIAI